MNRVGNWIQTYTGRKFWPLDPRPEEVCVEDIAHALSLVCRFGGHCKEFYSVAQHSVFVSKYCPNYPLWGLLHDAAEAYLGDLTRPLKVSLLDAGVSFYADAEAGVMRAVCDHFGLTYDQLKEVKDADRVLLYTERRDLFAQQLDWLPGPIPMRFTIVPMAPRQAECYFLDTYRELMS